MAPQEDRSWVHLLVAPRGSLYPGVMRRVLFFGALGSLAAMLYRWTPKAHLPLGMHEVAGAVIALVLAFRTNTAYARFWEGRGLWGSLVNAARNVMRLTRNYSTASPEVLRELATWIVVFAHASRRSLRGQRSMPELVALLTPEHLRALRANFNPPLYAAEQYTVVLAGMLRRGELAPELASRIEAVASVLVDCLGGCERISRTPTPRGFVRLLEGVLLLLLASLPFALVDELGILTPLITMMVTYPVLMIEGLGRELDDPFGHDPNDLPLSRLCDTLERTLLGTSSIERMNGVMPEDEPAE